jgi:hypothetical protein
MISLMVFLVTIYKIIGNGGEDMLSYSDLTIVSIIVNFTSN